MECIFALKNESKMLQIKENFSFCVSNCYGEPHKCIYVYAVFIYSKYILLNNFFPWLQFDYVNLLKKGIQCFYMCSCHDGSKKNKERTPTETL